MNLTFKEICSRAKAWPRLPSISKFQYCINWRHGHQRTLSFPFILCNFKFHISNSFLIAFSPSENSQTCSRTGSQGWCTIIAQLHNNCPMHFPAIWNNIMVMIQSYLCETSKWNLHNSCYNCRRALLVNDSFISILFPFHSISIIPVLSFLITDQIIAVTIIVIELSLTESRYQASYTRLEEGSKVLSASLTLTLSWICRILLKTCKLDTA